MKNSNKRLICLSLLIVNLTFTGGQVANATSGSHSLGNSGTVKVEGPEKSELIDPENPETAVDPGEGYSTTGPLRIDYISDLSFGLNKINATGRVYDSLAQLFHSETDPRGYYVQISDFRENVSGWQLQVAQTSQFNNNVIQNTQEQELVGATLSLTKAWANTNSGRNPGEIEITNEAIAISEIGASYTVAIADTDMGKGTWTIAFGGSPGYQENDLKGTLTPLVSEDNEPVMNTDYNKQAFSNSAVQLKVPNETAIYPVQYTTKLRWTLVAGPT